MTASVELNHSQLTLTFSHFCLKLFFDLINIKTQQFYFFKLCLPFNQRRHMHFMERCDQLHLPGSFLWGPGSGMDPSYLGGLDLADSLWRHQPSAQQPLCQSCLFESQTSSLPGADLNPYSWGSTKFFLSSLPEYSVSLPGLHYSISALGRIGRLPPPFTGTEFLPIGRSEPPSRHPCCLGGIPTQCATGIPNQRVQIKRKEAGHCISLHFTPNILVT